MFTALNTLLLVTAGTCSNVGWKSFMRENPTEFHDLPLTWETGIRVPEWLSGTYVRNGPAQVIIGLLSTANLTNLSSFSLLRN